MTRPPVAQTVRWELFFTDPESRTCAVTGWGSYAHPNNAAELLTIAEGIYGAAVSVGPGPYLMDRTFDLWTLTECKVSDNSGSSDVSSEYVHSTVGGSGGTALPPSTAVVVSGLINSRYRGGKPRMYWPGLTSVDIDTNGGAFIKTSSLTLWQNAANNFLTECNAIATPVTFTLGTIGYSRKHVTGWVPQFIPYQNMLVRSRLGTQRRRLGKVGA